jgi:hypothetical protein
MDFNFNLGRSKSLSIQQTIDFYMKIIPLPKMTKNKIIHMKFDNLQKNRRQSFIQNSASQGLAFFADKKNEIEFKGKDKRKGSEGNSKKSENISKRHLMFSPRLDPIVTNRTGKSNFSLKSKLKPMQPIFKTLNPQLNSKSKICPSPVPKRPKVYVPTTKPKSLILKSKPIQVEISDITLESWQTMIN